MQTDFPELEGQEVRLHMTEGRVINHCIVAGCCLDIGVSVVLKDPEEGVIEMVCVNRADMANSASILDYTTEPIMLYEELFYLAVAMIQSGCIEGEALNRMLPWYCRGIQSSIFSCPFGM